MNILSALRSKPSAESKKPAKQSTPKQTKGIEIKSQRELDYMRESSRIVATVLKEIAEIIAPGMTTMDLDAHAEKRIREMGAVPSFKGYCGFPASLCTSINNEVVHGIPNARKVIKLGDLVKVDTGAFKNGFHGDSCITVAVGMLDLAGAIEDHVKANGFAIVEDFTGHGVGRNLHEEPSVFNFRTHQLPNVRFRPGMTLAIEPILNAGSKRVRVLADKWTAVTVDNQLSAQFEHTVLVTETGYEIFTDRTKV
jgi:methionyl aminopeptidase